MELLNVVFLVELPLDLDRDDIDQMLSAGPVELRTIDGADPLCLLKVHRWGETRTLPGRPGFQEVMLRADRACFRPGLCDGSIAKAMKHMQRGDATAYFAMITQAPTIVIGYSTPTGIKGCGA